MAQQTTRYSIVIPVLNEAGNIINLYNEIVSVFPSHEPPIEIIFIDDGSTDGSLEILLSLHKQDQRVKIIQFRRNFGQTSAFAAGFEFATGEVIITLDADGQNNPADIPRLLTKMEEGDYDLVVGRRTNRKEPFSRRLLSHAANKIISKGTGILVHDRGCSLKCIRHDLARSMQLYGQLHRFIPELASVIGARVAEVDVVDRRRTIGKSKYGAISRTPRVILDLVTVIYLLLFFASPMRLFGSIALLCGSIGFSIAAILATTKIVAGIVGGWEAFHAYVIGDRPMLLLAVLLIVVGVQFLMMGLLGEMLVRVYYAAGHKHAYHIRKIID